MRTRRISITIVLLAMLVLLGVMSLAGLSGWTAAARVDQAAVSLQAYTFTGHVYRGQPYDTSTPVAGVTIGCGETRTNGPKPDSPGSSWSVR